MYLQEGVCFPHGKESVHEDGYRKCSEPPEPDCEEQHTLARARNENDFTAQRSRVETQSTQYSVAFFFLQLMQLSNFYCNWKTIHHRNFMVGLGGGEVLFTINDEIVCLWQYDYI